MAAAALLSLASATTRAANIFWDVNSSSAGTGNVNLNGDLWFYDDSAPFWYDAGSATTITGTNATDKHLFTSADTAYFTGTAGVVSLTDPITIGGLVFTNVTSGQYRLSNDNTLTLAAPGSGVNSPTISVDRSLRTVIDSQILGTTGLTKTGNGSLVLTNANNSFTGDLVIKGGSIVIDNVGQLGLGTTAISVMGFGNTGSPGYSGGALVLQGMTGNSPVTGLTLAREISVAGRGPGAVNASGSLISIGNNTLSGGLTLGQGNETRVLATHGVTTVSGDVFLGGSNGMIFFGSGNFAVSGLVTGADTSGDRLIKTGLVYDSTLWLQNNANTLIGTIRIDSGSVRVSDGGALGRSVHVQAVDLNNGRLEIRTDTPSSFATHNLYVRDSTTGTVLLDHALGSSVISQTITFGQLRAFNNNNTLTINGRSGYGATFQGIYNGSVYVIGTGGANNTTLNNNANGLITFLGSLWNQTDGTARTLSISGNGDTLITGNILAATTAAHQVTKNGVGTLTIQGGASTFIGNFNIANGTVAANSIGAMGATLGGAINLGSVNAATSAGAFSYLGAAGTGAGETTAKLFNLAATTSGGMIFANQSGSAPTGLVLTSGIAAGGTGAKNLYLGGNAASTVINQIQGVIQDSSSGATSVLKIGTSTWLYAPAAASYSPSAPVGVTVSSGGAAQTNSFTVSSATGLVVGMRVSGTNVPGNSVITAISGNTVYINNAISTAIAASTALTFANVTNFTGNLTIAGGKMQFQATANSGSGSDIINNTSTVTFGNDPLMGSAFAGGVFELIGSSTAGTLTESVGLLISNQGLGTVRVTANGGAPTLNFAGYATRLATAALRFEPGTGTGIQFAAVPTAVSNGILSGAYIVDASTGAIDFVATPATNTNIAALGSASDLSAAGAGAASGNYVLASAFTTAGAVAANSIRLTSGANLTLGGTLTITSASATALGGILHDNAGGALTISGSSITTSAANQELFIITGGTNNANALTISSVLANGTGGVTKAGSGLLILQGNNSFTGSLSIDEGTLRAVGNTSNLLGVPASGTVTSLRAGATLEVSNAGPLTAPYTGATAIPTVSIGTLSGSGTFSNLTTGAQAIVLGNGNSGNGNGGTYYGVLSDGAGKLTVIKNGSANQTLAGLNTYTGATIINGGTLAVTSIANIGQASGLGAGDSTNNTTNAASLIFSGGGQLLITGGTNTTYDGARVVNYYTTTQMASMVTDRLFTLAGDAQIQVNGTYGGNALARNENQAAVVFSNTAAIQYIGTGNRTLTLSGNGTGDNWLYMQLVDPSGGVLNVQRSGYTSYWTLGNQNNTYTGYTLVSGGALVALDGYSLPTASNLRWNDWGGAFQSTGTFSRTLGTGAGQWQATFRAGFAADTAPFVVDFGPLNNPIWGGTGANGGIAGTQYFLKGGLLELNSTTSTSNIEVRGNFQIVPGVAATGLAGTAANNVNTLDTASANVFNITIGQLVTGTNIPANTYITGINTSGQLVMSQNTTGAVTGFNISGAGWREISVLDNGNTGLDFATVSGVISGTGNLAKSGGATYLVLGNANTYSGNTILRSEGLVVTSIGASGATSSSLGTNVGGGWLEIGNPGNGTTARLQYVGAGETATRTIYIAGTTGTRSIDSSGSGPLVLTNLFNTDATTTLTTLASTSDRTLELRGTNTDFNTVTSILADSIGSSLRVAKSDGGTWLLTGVNTYTGGTSLNGGNFGIGGMSAIGATGVVSAAGANSGASTTLKVASTTGIKPGMYVNGPGITFGDLVSSVTNGTDVVINNSRTATAAGNYVFGGLLISNTGLFTTNAGGLTINQPVVMNNNSTVSFVGAYPITVSNTIYKVTGGNDTTLTNNLENGSVLTLGDYTSWDTTASTTRTLNIRGTGNTVWNGVISNSSAGVATAINALNVAMASDATLTLGGSASTYSGGFTLTQGTVIANKATAFGTGTLNFNGGVIQAGASMGGTLSNTVLFNGELSYFTGTNSITLSGTVTNNGGNRYMGNTLSGGATLTLSNTVNIANDNTANRIFVLIGSGTTNITGVIANGGTSAGTVYLRGDSTYQLNLTGANTFSGELRLEGGTTTLSGASGALSAISATAGSGILVRAGATFTVDNSVNNNAARISDTGAVSLEGGTFNFIGNTTAETVGALRAYGTAAINLTGTGTNTLTFASIDFTNFTDPRSALNLLGSTSLGVNNKLKFTAGITSSGLVVRFLTSTTDFGAYDLTNGVTTFSGYTTPADINTAVAADVVKVTSSTTGLTTTANRTIRGLAIADTSARTLTGSDYQTLTIGSGGVIVSGGVTHVLSVPRLSFSSTTSITTNTTGGTEKNVVVPTTAGLTIGQLISGTGIAGSTYITGITNGTTITINNNATAAGTVTGTFSAPAFFNVAASTTLDLQSTVFSTSDITKFGAGTLLFTAKQFLNNQLSVEAGTVKMIGDNRVWAAQTGGAILNVEKGATLDLNGSLQFVGQLRSLGSTAGAGGNIINSAGTQAVLAVSMNGSNQSFAGAIAGDIAFLRTAGFTLTLFGNQTYTGPTFLTGGTTSLQDSGAFSATSDITMWYSTIAIDNNANFRVQNNNRINDSAPITMRGGSLTIQGLYNTMASEKIGALTLQGGDNNISLTHAQGGAIWAMDLTVASLTRSFGATLNFTATNSNQGQLINASHLYVTAPLTTVNRGMLGAWAIANNTDYLAYNTSLGMGVVGQGGFVGYDADFGSGKITQIPVQVDSNYAIAPTDGSLDTTFAAVLRLSGRAYNNITFGASNRILNLQLGGLLRSNDPFASSIGTAAVRGILTAGGTEASGTRELVIYNASTGQPTWGSASVTTGSAIVTGLTTVGLKPGMTITSGSNFAAGTTVVSVDSYNQVTLSSASTATATGQTLTGGVFINGSTTTNSAVITMNSTTGLVPGMTLSGTGIPTGSYILSVDSATQVTLSKPATATAVSSITFTSNLNEFIINSVIADNGYGNSVALVKSGPGVLDLTAPNTYSGGTFVNQGTLNLNPTNPGDVLIPAGTLTINGGTGGTNIVAVNANASGVISANVDLVINGSGRLQYADNLTNTLKSVTFNNAGGENGGGNLSFLGLGTNGFLNLTSANAITATSSNPQQVSTISGGRLTLVAGANVFSVAGIVLPGTSKVFTDLIATLSITSVVAGSDSSVTKTGAGLLQLSAANEFNGLTVSGGGIIIGGNSVGTQGGGFVPGPLGGGQVTMASGTRLLVNNADRTVGNDISWAGTPVFDNNGNGTMRTLTLNGRLNGAGLNSATPTIQINSPWLTVALLGKIDNIANITSFTRTGQGRLIFNSTGYTGNFNATALGLSTAVSLLNDGDGTGRAEIVDLGAVIFDSGVTPNITVGRAGGYLPYGFAANKLLRVTSVSNIGSLGLTLTNSNGYGLELDGAITFSGTPALIVNNASISTQTQGLVLNGTLTGTAFGKFGNGTVVLGGTNSFTGNITISGGVLSISSSAQLGNAANVVVLSPSSGFTSTLRVTDNLTFTSGGRTIQFGNSSDTRAIEVVEGKTFQLDTAFVVTGQTGAALVKNDNGVLVLNADNSAWTTGALTINAGVVRLTNSLAAGPSSKTITFDTTNIGKALQLANNITVSSPFTTSGGNQLLGGIDFGGALENYSGNNTYAGLITMPFDLVIGSTSGKLTISGGITNSTSERQLYFSGAGDIDMTSTFNVSGISQFNYIQKYGTGTLTISSLNTVAINSSNFLMVRQGTLKFTGNSSWRSNVYVDSGATLTLDNTAFNADLGRMYNTVGPVYYSLSIRGGNFNLIGRPAGAGNDSTEAFGKPIFQRGFSTFTLTTLDNTYQTVLAFQSAMDSQAPAQTGTVIGSSVLFRGTLMGSAPNPGVSTIRFVGGLTFNGQTGGSNSTNKGIMPWALVDNSATGQGFSFATSDATSGTGAFVRALNNAEYSNSATFSANNNMLLNTTSGNATVTGSVAPNSITIDNSRTITMNAGVKLNLSSGGILVRSGSTSSMTGGVLDQTSNFSPLNVWTVGDFTLASAINGGNGINNGNIGFVKAGAGTLTIAPSLSTISGLGTIGINTMSGQFVLNAGTVKLGTGVNNAIFANNYFALTGGTLDLNGTSQQIFSLFADQAYANANGTVTSSSGTGHLIINQDNSARNWAGSFSGNINLTRSGFSTLTLYSSSNMTGTAIFNGGSTVLRDNAAFTNLTALEVDYATLTLDNQTSTVNSSNRLADGATVALRGGTLTVIGRAQTATTERIGVVSLLQGNNWIIATQGGTGVNSIDLTLTGLNRTAGQGEVTFRAVNGGQLGSFPRIKIDAINGTSTSTLGAGLTNGIIGGWAIFDSSGNPSDWATYVPGLGVGALGQNGFPGYAPAQVLTNATQATDNVKLGAYTSYLTENVAVNSLNTQNVSGIAINIAAGKTLTITSGGILSFNNQSWTIGNVVNQGFLTSGQSELFLYAQGNTGPTINSVITGAINVVKYGSGPTVFASTNNYTGGTTVNGGTLTVAATGVIPLASDITKGLVISGGTVAGSSTQTNVALTRVGAVDSGNIVTLNGMGAITYWGNNTQAGLIFNNLGGLTNPVVNTYTNSAAAVAAFGIDGDNGVLTIGSSGIVASSSNVGSISTVNGRIDFGASPNTITVNPITVNGVTDASPLVASLALQTIVGSTGGITKYGNGVLQLNSQSIFTGGLTIAAGGLKNGANVTISNVAAVAGIANAGSRFARLTLNSGARYDLNNASTTWGSLAGGGDIFSSFGTPTLNIGYDNTSSTFSGRFQRYNDSVFALINKIGTGTLTLDSAQDAGGSWGSISVSGGILRYAGNGKAFVGTSSVTAGTFNVNTLGTLALDNTSTNVNSRLGLNTAGTLNVQGGRVTLGGNSGANTTETITSLTVQNGGGRIELTPNGSRALTLALTNLTAQGGTGTLVFGGLTGAASANGVANLTITNANYTNSGQQGTTNNGTSTMAVRGDILADASVSGLGTGFLVKDTVTGNWRALGTSSAGATVAGEYNTVIANWVAKENGYLSSVQSLLATTVLSTLTTSGTATLNSSFDAANFGLFSGGGLLNLQLTGAGALLVKDGTLTLNVGTLTTNAASALIAHVLTGATLDLNGYVGVNGTGGFIKADGGVMNFNRAAYYTGATVVNGGTLNLNSGAANTLPVIPTAGAATLSNLYINDGSAIVDLMNQSQAVGSFGSLNSAYIGAAGTLTNSGLTTVDFTAANQGGVNFGGSITGNLNFIRSGNNTTLLTGVNTYTGKTIVRGGVLQLRDEGVITGTGGIELNYGQLFLDNWSLTKMSDLTPTRINAANAITMQGGSLRFDSGGGTNTAITINSLTLKGGNNSISVNVYQGSGSSEYLTIGNLNYTSSYHGGVNLATFTTLNSGGATSAGGQGQNSSRTLISQITQDNVAYTPVRRLFTNAVTTAGSNVITVGSTAGLGLTVGMNVTGIPGITGTAVITAISGTTITVNLAGTTGTVTASTTASVDVDNLTNGILGGWFIANGSTFATYDSVYGVTELGVTNGAFTGKGYTGTDITAATVVTGNYSDGNTNRTMTTGVKQFNTVRLGPGANSTITPVSGTSYEFGTGWMSNANVTILWDAIDATNTMKGLGADLFIFVNQNTNTISTPIIGTAALNYLGNSTLSLAPKFASNSYTGGTYVNGGTLALNGTGGAAPIVIPGNLTITNAAVTMNTTANQIATSANLTFNGFGRITLANYTGATTQTLASLTFNNDGGNGDPALIYGTPTALSTIILSAATPITSTNNSLSFTPSITTSSAANSALQFSNANPVILVNAGAGATGLNIAVPITQNGSMTSLTKSGNGLLALSAANTFTSDFTLSGGSLLLGVDTVGAAFNSITSGPVGKGTLIIGGGTAILSNAAARTIINAVTVNGNFSFGGVNQLNNVTLTGPVSLGASARTISVDSVAVTATINGALTSSVGGTGLGLTKIGNGTLVLGANNSASLGTVGITVSGGILKFANANAINSGSLLTVAAGAGTDLNGNSMTLNQFAGSGYITNSAQSSATLTFGTASDFTFAGSFADNSGLNTSPSANTSRLVLSKNGSGKVTLTGVSVNAGDVFVNAGILEIGAGGRLGTGTANVTTELRITRNDSFVFANDVIGTGALTKYGSGTTSVTGSAAPSSVSIVEGALQIGNGGNTGDLGSASVDIATGTTLRVNRANAFTMLNFLTGAGVFEQAGSNTTTLAAGTSFTGTATVSGGTLELSVAGALTSAAEIIVGSGATLLLSADGANNGDGIITLNGGTLANANNATSVIGTLNLNGGTLTGSSNSGLGSYSFRGTVNVNQDTTIAASDLVSDYGYVPEFNVASGKVLTVSGSIINTVIDQTSFTKTGTGTMILTGANTYTGVTTISAGTLQVGNNTTTGSLGGVDIYSFLPADVVNNGTLVIKRSNAYQVDNVISGTGDLVQAGTGTTTLTGANSYTGATIIMDGILAIDDLAQLGSSLATDRTKFQFKGGKLLYTGATAFNRAFTVYNGGAGFIADSDNPNAFVISGANKVDFDDAASTGRALSLSGTSTLANTFSATAFEGADSLAGRAFSSLVKNGVGTWVIAGGSSLFDSDAVINVNAGILGFTTGSLGSGSANINLANNSVLRWESGNTSDVASRLKVADGATATIRFQDTGSATTFSSSMSFGTGGLIKDGPGALVLAASNTFSGGLTVSEGKVTVTNSGAFGSGSATVGGSGQLIVNTTTSTPVTVNSGGAIGGGGTVGAIVGQTGGIIAPGNSSGGILSASSLTLNPGTVVEWQVWNAGLSAGNGYDSIALTGALNVSSNYTGNKIVLKIISLTGPAGSPNTNPTGFAVGTTKSFTFATIGSLNLGSNATINDVFTIDVSQFKYSDGSASNAGLWSLSYSAGTVTLTAVPEPSTYGFGLAALALAAAALRRRRQKKAQADTATEA